VVLVNDETLPRGGDNVADAGEGDLQWFRSFTGQRKWQRGKADPSHEYTIRSWVPEGESDFERAVEIIRELGQSASFWSKTYVYLQLEGMKYWTMGDSISETTVLNRAEA
jgi:hypothetical protein